MNAFLCLDFKRAAVLSVQHLDKAVGADVLAAFAVEFHRYAHIAIGCPVFSAEASAYVYLDPETLDEIGLFIGEAADEGFGSARAEQADCLCSRHVAGRQCGETELDRRYGLILGKLLRTVRHVQSD